MLEVPERRIRALVKSGRIRVVGQGKWNAQLLDRDDIDEVGRSFLYAHFGRRTRQVHVHVSLSDQALALEVSGVEVLVCSSIMDALSKHEGDGKPILVLPASLESRESALLATIRGDVELLLVSLGEGVRVPFDVESVIAAGDLRLLVTSAWRLITRRKSGH